jgi:tRNA (cmo5U34)-methyltransferase
MTDIADTFATGGWEFTPEVTAVFDDHVRASVPFYDHIQNLVAELSDWLLPNNGCYADLGASTGTTLVAIAERHPTRRIRAELYDEEASMLDVAKKKIEKLNVVPTLNLQRLQQPFKHREADMTVALFTLQFLAKRDRLHVLSEAHRCSAKSGVIVLAEKIRPDHALLAEIANDVSHDYKSAAGISDTAIRSKARALRGVLVPQTISGLTTELYEAGWRKTDVLFRWHQWVIVIGFAR